MPKKNVLSEDDGSGFLKREIPSGHAYDPKALKPLARTLWSASRALGHALSAHRHFTQLKSSSVSPDGLLGGVGYVSTVKRIRQDLYDICEKLSSLSDTLHDEINAPHWKPQLASLEKSDIETVERLVSDAEKVLETPEQEVREDFEGIKLARFESGNSSVPVGTLPGPRIKHLDRGDVDQLGPLGAYGPESDYIVDPDRPWGDDYRYRSEWDNELLDRSSSSLLPEDSTPTDSFDFGLGYGAKGRAILEDPKSPHSESPDGSEWKTEDHSTLPTDIYPSVARSDYYDGDKGDNMVNAHRKSTGGKIGNYIEWDITSEGDL